MTAKGRHPTPRLKPSSPPSALRGRRPVEADILQPAETLLDLYGEDIRARAYVTTDPLRGEMMLRPDFTVPVVQAHMAHGAEPARYCYMGEVFRKQDTQAPRQRIPAGGVRLFDRTAPEQADARSSPSSPACWPPEPSRRDGRHRHPHGRRARPFHDRPPQGRPPAPHLAAPNRFRALLDRFSGRAPMPAARAALLDRLQKDSPEALIEAAGTLVGLRSPEDIAARARALIEDAATPPSPRPRPRSFTTSVPAGPRPRRAEPSARHHPHAARHRPRRGPLRRRLDALARLGIDTATLPFEASHGRTTLEYYDGFVFSFHAADPALPPVASGGRYDALTAVLGQAAPSPPWGASSAPASSPG
jgi:ATP phosphoribosyltransferase regulatory subunit